MVDRSGDPVWDAALGQAGDLVRGAGAPSFASRLDRWVADARVDDAALRRSRERWLREVAEQEATLRGVLADLAERRAPVLVRTVSARHHQGLIQVVGADFVALRLRGGADVLLAVGTIGVVRTAPTVEAALGDRVVPTELRLADVLAALAAERERVVLVTLRGDDAVAGELRSVGVDVAVLRTDGEQPGSAYIPLAAIGEVTIG